MQKAPPRLHHGKRKSKPFLRSQAAARHALDHVTHSNHRIVFSGLNFKTKGNEHPSSLRPDTCSELWTTYEWNMGIDWCDATVTVI
ncbi:hypothetical protein EJB05_49509 [Eragrostis curvula]|uniref:Uncharacterized protein n=1 Tax=Eragrostis curvula TaxID=38414 RepID=A0A5J9T4P2_9POAL|nr:hypothetical protein EJB05_49509 [Eragrostis curvula]